MRIRAHPIFEPWAYPCSKASVREAFSQELLDGVVFGLRPVFQLDPRNSPKPKIQGTVILALAMHLTNPVIDLGRSSLYVYRARKQDLSEPVRMAVFELMRGSMRHWLQGMLSRSETEVFGADELLIELRDSTLLLHETRFR